MTIEENCPDEGPSVSAGDGRPRLLVWQDELNASPGFRAVALMSYIRRIGYVFQGNVAQYKALVARVQDSAFQAPIFDVRNPQAHDDLLSEVERLLHNVLMALSTRIDQQRAFIKRHCAGDSEFTAEYQAGVQSHFRGYAPGPFLRDLRNYLTHNRLPVAMSRQTLSRFSISVTFVLGRQPLLDWGGWTSAAKKWLIGQGDEIEIVDAVDGYARIAGSFDKWLHDRIGLKHVVEIRQYEEAAKAFDREWDRVFG